MLLGKQVRAIRAMAGDMTREQFCDVAGISINALDNVEAGNSYQKKTENRILRVISSLGYRLTENGVEESNRDVVWLENYEDLLADISLNGDKDVLFLNADDSKSSKNVTDATTFLVTKFKCKFLCPDSATLFTFKDLAKYRRSELLGARDVSVIYGDRVGLYTPDGVMLVSNKWIAEDYRKQFTTLWENAHDV